VECSSGGSRTGQLESVHPRMEVSSPFSPNTQNNHEFKIIYFLIIKNKNLLPLEMAVGWVCTMEDSSL